MSITKISKFIVNLYVLIFKFVDGDFAMSKFKEEYGRI
jgi:hypothetical protein